MCHNLQRAGPSQTCCLYASTSEILSGKKKKSLWKLGEGQPRGTFDSCLLILCHNTMFPRYLMMGRRTKNYTDKYTNWTT